LYFSCTLPWVDLKCTTPFCLCTYFINCAGKCTTPFCLCTYFINCAG
jgi:hypothetical protein